MKKTEFNIYLQLHAQLAIAFLSISMVVIALIASNKISDAGLTISVWLFFSFVSLMWFFITANCIATYNIAYIKAFNILRFFEIFLLAFGLGWLMAIFVIPEIAIYFFIVMLIFSFILLLILFKKYA